MKRLVLTLMVAAATLLGRVRARPVGRRPAPIRAGSVVRRSPTNVPSVAPRRHHFTATVTNCLPGETVDHHLRSNVSQTPSPATPTIPAGERRLRRTHHARHLPGVRRPHRHRRHRARRGHPADEQSARRSRCAAAGPTVPPVPIPGGGLPATGSSGLGTTTTSAIVLLGAGALLLIVSQVRRRRTAPRRLIPAGSVSRATGTAALRPSCVDGHRHASADAGRPLERNRPASVPDRAPAPPNTSRRSAPDPARGRA